MENIISHKYQDVVLDPFAFCCMQASMLLGLFCHTIRRAAEVTWAALAIQVCSPVKSPAVSPKCIHTVRKNTYFVRVAVVRTSKKKKYATWNVAIHSMRKSQRQSRLKKLFFSHHFRPQSFYLRLPICFGWEIFILYNLYRNAKPQPIIIFLYSYEIVSERCLLKRSCSRCAWCGAKARLALRQHQAGTRRVPRTHWHQSLAKPLNAVCWLLSWSTLYFVTGVRYLIGSYKKWRKSK